MINRQDYINSFEQDITMVRGDTLIFGFELLGLEGELPDLIKFKCTDNYENSPDFSSSTLDGGIILENYDEGTDTATYSVRVQPMQTSSLAVGRYHYDITMSFDDVEDVYTLQRGNLDLVPNVKGA